MDKQLITDRFTKAVGSYSHEASAQLQIAVKMARLLSVNMPHSCNSIFEFGCGTGNYSRLLLEQLTPKRLVLNDICGGMKVCFEELLSEQVSFLEGDAESLSLPKAQNLITSCSALQWFCSPSQFFARCNEALSENGYLAFSTFGRENMYEIAQITGSGLAYYPKEELERMLSVDYQLIHSEEEQIKLCFDSPMEVLYHLKRTGVTGTSKRKWTKGELARFCEEYIENFSVDGKVHLTYHPIYIIVKKKGH